jgi:trehalose synthase
MDGEMMPSRSASAPTVTERQNADASLEVPTGSMPVEQLRAVLCGEAWARPDDALGGTARALAGRAVWMVNSTSVGGGVAELLRSWLPYWRAAGIDQHRAVVSADSAFFQVTKRIPNFFTAIPATAASSMSVNVASTTARWPPTRSRSFAYKPGDIVVLHDPQTAGLLPALRAPGAIVVWRSHVGDDCPNPLTAAAWAFLEPYSLEADADVFSSRPHMPPLLRHAPMAIIPPCIDPTSTKNRDLDPAQARAILAHACIAQPSGPAVHPSYHRHDGSPRRLKQRATVRRLGNGPCIGSDRRVVHLTRWDRLKDPIGVLDPFAGPVLDAVEAHLILAGPTARAVADDPESEEVYDHVERRWEALPAKRRKRIEPVRLPMADLDDPAAIVNALQSQANVVFKKSGGGARGDRGDVETASCGRQRRGGTPQPIQDGVSRVLVNDPRDHARFGDAVATLLEDPAGAQTLGHAAHRRVRERHLLDRHAARWATLCGYRHRKPRAAPTDASPDERERGRHPTGSARPVEQLARTRRVEDAVQLMNELVGLGNDVALSTNEIEPTTGALRGNTPKNLGHLALISAALAHTEEMER